MKRANGTGTVVKLSGNRRNPWFAKITTGYDDKGHPISYVLDDDKGQKYFSTRTVPDLLLAKHNQQHFNVDMRCYTLKDVFDSYKDKNFPTKKEIELEKLTHIRTKNKLGYSNAASLQVAYNNIDSIHNLRYRELRTYHFQDVINKHSDRPGAANSIKLLLVKLDKFALEHDIIEKGYAEFTMLEQKLTKPEKSPFTNAEIQKLWALEGDMITDILLILLYTGMRIEELLILENKNIDLKNMTMVGGIKTKAGRNRVIPLHSKIYHIVKRYYDVNNKYLILVRSTKFKYGSYRYKFNKMMEKLKFNHTTHETRHTITTFFNGINANKKCVESILGHEGDNIESVVYTHKTIEELRETIELINYDEIKIQTFKVI
ncbi:MAG: tyrosine-type recombinase/integrase [Clostridia bacterium]